MKDGYKVVNGGVVIPDGVTCIENWAFAGCENLKSIVIPDYIVKIGRFAFKDCVNLKSVVIPDSVIHIGDSAFAGCKSLTTVVISDELLEKIDIDAFYGSPVGDKLYDRQSELPYLNFWVCEDDKIVERFRHIQEAKDYVFINYDAESIGYKDVNIKWDGRLFRDSDDLIDECFSYEEEEEEEEI